MAMARPFRGDLAANAGLALSSLLWATGFSVSEVLLESWDANFLAAARVGVAAVILIVWPAGRRFSPVCSTHNTGRLAPRACTHVSRCDQVLALPRRGPLIAEAVEKVPRTRNFETMIQSPGRR